MPLTYQGIDELFAKKLITPQERSILRQNFLQEQNQVTSITSKFVSHLSDEVSKSWPAMLASLKQTGTELSGTGTAEAAKAKDTTVKEGQGQGMYSGAFFVPLAEAGWHALSLLMSPVTSAGKATGEHAQDYLLKAGANPNVAAIVGTLIDSGVQTGAQVVAGKGISLVKSSLLKDAVAQIVPEATITKAVTELEKQNPANLVDIIRQPQDIRLPGGGGVVTGERKLLAPPPGEAALRKSIEDSAQARIDKMNNAHDLLSQAQETIAMPVKSETQKTLDAAAATLRGGSTAEQLLNQQQLSSTAQAANDLLTRMAEARAKGTAVGGGRPSPEDYAKQFNQVVKEYQTQLERYQAHGLSREMADSQASKLLSEGYGLNDIMAIMPQEAKNPAQTLAVIKTAMPYAEETMKLREAARTDPEAFDKIIGNMTTLFGVNPKYFGIRSTAGQTLGIYRDPTFGKTKFLEQFHEAASWLAGVKIDTPEAIQQNRDRILNVLDQFKDPEQLIKHQLTMPGDEMKQPMTWMNFWTGYFAQNLLSPIVVTKKIFGDTAATLYHQTVEKQAQRALSPINSLLGNPAGLTINDIPVSGETTAALYGYKSGWMRAYDFIKNRDFTGLANETGEGALKNQHMSLADFLDERFGKAGAIAGNALSVIPNSIKVLTNAARLAAFEAETSGRLFREGTIMNLTGDALASHIEDGRRNLAPNIMKAGLEASDKGTFTDAPGAFASWVSQGLNQFQVMKLDIPFWRIPINLLRWGYQRAPILNLSSVQNMRDLSGGGIEAIDAASKILIGNIAGGALILGGRAGWITGSGPNDPKLRSEMIQSGAFKPFSIWNPIANNWYDYSPLHPIKPILGTAADIGYLWNELPWNQGLVKNTENAMLAFGAATARNFGENPFFTGITGAAKTIDEMMRGTISGTQATERAVGNFITGFIPWGSTMRYVAQTLDPGLKEVHGVMDVIQSSLPFLNSTLFPKRDIYGKPESLPDVYGPRMLSIFRSRDGTEDPVAKEDFRLQMSFSDQGDHIGGPVEAADPTKIVSKTGVPLNPDEQDFRDQRLGELYHQNALELQNSPSYQQMSDIEKIKERRNIRGLARGQATGETTDKFPAFKARIDAHMAAGDTSVSIQDPIGQGTLDYQAARTDSPANRPQISQPAEEIFPITDSTAPAGAQP